MNTNNNQTEQATELRKRAEEIARQKAAQSSEDLEAAWPEEARKLLHELRVHQIELEMQNEELRRAHVELGVTRARYFDLYDLAPVGYCTISEKGLIMEANLTAATLLGAARSGLVKYPFSHFIHSEDQDIYYLFLRRIFKTHSESSGQTDELQGCELRMVKKDGTEFWVRLEGANSQNVHNTPFYRIVMSDITHRKQAEEERFELEKRLQQVQKAESLGRMASAIAHHFNNQLTAVMGNLEMLMEDLPRDATSLKKLTRAMTAARKAAEVSSLMLTYLGQTTANKEPIDISEVCRRSLTLLRAALSRTISVEGESPYPGPMINGNANQIQQVLTNLIINAGESCEGRGSVHLCVKTVSAESILGSHQYPNDWQPQDKAYACLEVRDSGCGIIDKDIEKIFDPFFTTKFTGRGLGLAVVLGILRAHHGAITVESEPGMGSIFRVFLPVSAEAVIRSPEKKVSTFEVEGGGTVLLVEDEEQVRKMARMMLMRLSFTVLEARDGVEAVEVFSQHRDEIRCVLSDLTMPRMNGWETLTALRELSPGIPVVLASGYNESQVMAGDHPDRPDAFLQKPFSIKDLAAVIRQVLAQE